MAHMLTKLIKYSSCKKRPVAIHNLALNSHTTEYFKNAKKITDLYESQISKHMSKCFNLKAKILPKHSDIHNYCTWNSNKFIAPNWNMKKSEMSIKFKSIKVWNKLPADIRTSDSLNVFMDNLRNYYTSHGTDMCIYEIYVCTDMFYFLRYAVSLCNVLPTIGQ